MSLPRPSLADTIEAALLVWAVPTVKSEKELDLLARNFVRAEVQRRLPDLPETELPQWVVGHRDPTPRYWTESKAYQNIRLWGAGKTADLFVYHPNGRYGLPQRGLSVEVKYLPRGGSYAGAIATIAGQLLAYSIRHERTIGFVWCDGPPRRTRREAHAPSFLKALPPNARLLVRFRE
jgi:hypothetical protein